MKLKELINEYGEYEVKEGFKDMLIEPKPNSIYDLKYGDQYWFIDDEGFVLGDVWTDHRLDNNRLLMNNIFLTEEEGILRKEYLKIRAELIKLGGREYFKVNENNYCLCFDCYAHELFCYSPINNYNDIYFDMQEQARNAIKEIGKERLLKYWFRTKEVE